MDDVAEKTICNNGFTRLVKKMGCIVQLKSDEEGRNLLQNAIIDYYESQDRDVILYKETVGLDEWLYLSFLVDKKHVIRYAVGKDPNPQGDRWVGGVESGIGPDSFNPSLFWSYENFERFRQSADTESVIHNLKVLDEYLGFPKL